jgi:hypothetical protein
VTDKARMGFRVYATSFFSPFCDFNTLDLKVCLSDYSFFGTGADEDGSQIGPVSINLQRFFREMPIRYTLRSTRPEGNVEGAEEESFVTISFKSRWLFLCIRWFAMGG